MDNRIKEVYEDKRNLIISISISTLLIQNNLEICRSYLISFGG